MGRKLAKRFITCFGFCSIFSLAIYFYQGGTLNIELLRTVVLAAFLVLNLLYLSLLIERTDSTVAIVSFVVIALAGSLYFYIDRTLDLRLYFVPIFVTLIVINVIATFVLRKSSAP